MVKLRILSLRSPRSRRDCQAPFYKKIIIKPLLGLKFLYKMKKLDMHPTWAQVDGDAPQPAPRTSLQGPRPRAGRGGQSSVASPDADASRLHAWEKLFSAFLIRSIRSRMLASLAARCSLYKRFKDGSVRSFLNGWRNKSRQENGPALRHNPRGLCVSFLSLLEINITCIISLPLGHK